jgi:hypothetical protein
MTRPNPVRRGKSRPVAPTRRVGAPYRKRAPAIPVNELITSGSGEHWRKRADEARSVAAMPAARRDRENALPDAWWRTRIWRTQGATQRQLQARPVHR